jgi:hypothetical protein
MDAVSYPGESRGKDSINGPQIARVHYIRLQSPERAPKASINIQIFALSFIQRNYRYVARLHTIAEFRVIFQANYGLAISRLRNVVEQIDDTVLQTTHIESKYDVCNKWPLVSHSERTKKDHQ